MIQIPSWLTYFIVGLLVLGLLTFLLALHQLRRGRTGPYWRLRRAAGQRGGQLFLVSLTLFGLALTLAFFSGLGTVALNRVNSFLRPMPNPVIIAVPTFTETVPPVPTLTPSPAPTSTPDPTATTPPSSTPVPSPTTPPTVTLTPSPTFEVVLNLTAPPALRQPAQSAALRFTAAAETIGQDGQPAEALTVFPAGIERIYLFFTYRQMQSGVQWSRLLYRDGVPVQGSAFLWSMSENGSSHFFFGNQDGYPPGNYEARLLLNGESVSTLRFRIE
jgi:hypothetical protein